MANAKNTQKKQKTNTKTVKAPPVSVKAKVPSTKKPVKKTSPKKSTENLQAKVITPKKSVKKINSKNLKSAESVVKISSTKSKVTSTKSNQKFYDQLKLSESYVSLILGAVVVIGVSVLFLFFVQGYRNTNTPKSDVLNSSISPVLTKAAEQTYKMSENETLWDVAVKFYGDGFAYPRIIEANKTVITNPDFVPPGTVIIIPNAK